MENKWMNYSCQVLDTVMNFLIVFCLETFVFASFSNLESLVGEAGSGVQTPGLLRQVLFLAVPLLFLIIREKAGHFLTFVACHAAGAAAAVFLLGNGGMQKVVFGILAGGYLVRSFQLRIARQEVGEGQLGPVAGGDCRGSFLSGMRLSGKRSGMRPDCEYGPALYVPLFCIFLSGASGPFCTVQPQQQCPYSRKENAGAGRRPCRDIRDARGNYSGGGNE